MLPAGFLRAPPWLHLHRSWTGLEVFAVRFVAGGGGGARAVEAEVNYEGSRPRPGEDVAATIERLIWVLLASHARHARRARPSPAPPPSPRETLAQWASLGRSAIGFRLRPGVDPHRLGTSTLMLLPDALPTARYSGALVGLACGDALGAPAEFVKPERMRERFGRLTEMVGGGQCGWAPGEWTDDTAMALAVAEGILAAPEDPVEEVGRRFLAWYEAAPKDVGATIASAIRGYRDRGDWALASRSTPQAQGGKAAGNGSLMRTLPVAMAYPERERMLAMSARISAMTHWDPQAELACAIYCLWVRGVLRGRPLADAWREALAAGREVEREGQHTEGTPGPGPVPDDCWARLERAADLPLDRLQPSGYAGYVVECLEAAAALACQCSTTETALIAAANLGGETDTIGAIVGGVCGAARAGASLRRSWLAALHERERLEEVGRRLAKLRHELTYATPELPAFESWTVAPGLVAGRNPLTAVDVARLYRSAIQTVIDLREEHEWDGGRFGAEAVAEQELAEFRRLHVPIPDGEAPSAEDFDRVWSFLRESAGEHVYVHCRAGRERTAAVVAAYLARSEGWSYEETLRRLADVGYPGRPLPEQERAVREWLASRGDA